MIRGLELPLHEAIRRYPRLLPFLLQLGIDVMDTNYVVRFGEDGLEIGYPDDDWLIAA